MPLVRCDAEIAGRCRFRPIAVQQEHLKCWRISEGGDRKNQRNHQVANIKTKQRASTFHNHLFDEFGMS